MRLRLFAICLKTPIIRICHLVLFLMSAAAYVVGYRIDAHASQILAAAAATIALLLFAEQVPHDVTDED